MAEALFFRFLGGLPWPVLHVLSRFTYLLLYYVAGYRKAVVQENLKNAFPEKNATELTSLAKKFYRQLTEVALEILKTRTMEKAEFCARVSLRNPQLLREASGGFRQSVILLTIHQGNWEWMLHGITAALDIPIDPVYKPLHNRALDKLMLDIRQRHGARPVALTQVAGNILSHRRQFRCLAMLADQSPTATEGGWWTTFMNQGAAFHAGPERLARMSGFPVVFAQCRRLRRGYYEVEFFDLGSPASQPQPGALTESYVQLAERAIRAQPESWLWSNRRWKRQRGTEQLAGMSAQAPN